MVSQKTITSLDFKTLEEYYQYILDSYINGNLMQVENLITEFSKNQKKDFITWLDYCDQDKETVQYCKSKTITLL